MDCNFSLRITRMLRRHLSKDMQGVRESVTMLSGRRVSQAGGRGQKRGFKEAVCPGLAGAEWAGVGGDDIREVKAALWRRTL